jgi:7-cyano-7-deazaguanine synthase
VPGARSHDEQVYLPGKNILLLATAAVYSAEQGISRIALAPLSSNPFPDATQSFFKRFENALSQGLGTRIRIWTPYLRLSKSAVLKRSRIGLPFQHTLSCLRPVRALHCGRCNKCAERKRAFRAANIPDPTHYL